MFVDRHGPYQESISREPSMVIEYTSAEDAEPDDEDDEAVSTFLLNI